MAHLKLSLLGPFEATLDGRPVERLNSAYLRALLAYLAVESQRKHPREQVAALLWPERSDQEARSSLRYALSKLHSALGDRQPPGCHPAAAERPATSPFLLITRQTMQLDPQSDTRVDVAEFRRYGGRQPNELPIASLQLAADLCQGDFGRAARGRQPAVRRRCWRTRSGLY